MELEHQEREPQPDKAASSTPPASGIACQPQAPHGAPHQSHDVPGTESTPPMSVCKFNQRGYCRFGDSCKNLHPTGQAQKPVTEAPCIFFARGQCIKGDTCSFAHSKPDGAWLLDATGPRLGNNLKGCRYWSKGTCNKGDACPFVHSGVEIPPAYDGHSESPVSTPTLTPPTSDDIRDIGTLDVEYMEPEIHALHASSDPEGFKERDYSQEPDIASSTGPPLDAEPDIFFHTLSTSSDEGCRKTPRIDAGTLNSSTHTSPVSPGLGIAHEDSQQNVPLEENAWDGPLDSSGSHVHPEKYRDGEGAASAGGPFFHAADTYPDGELCGSHHPRPEDQATDPLCLPHPTSPASVVPLQGGIEGGDHPASWQSANIYGGDQSYEQGLTTEGVHHLYSEEAEQLVQNSTKTPQSELPDNQNLDMKGESQTFHPFLTSPEAPEDVPHWTQYADPFSDPAIPFCKFFAQARCNQRDVCSFRHTITVNEYALLFRDPQPPLWSPRPQLLHTGHAIPSTVSAFGICKFYPLGKCRNGDGCTYLHAPPSISAPVDSEQQEGWAEYSGPATPPYFNREIRPCRYHVENGYCKKENECPFRHDMDGQSSQRMYDNQDHRKTEWRDAGTGEGVTRRTQPCKYFREGSCRKGGHCNFLHDDVNTGEERDDGWEETASDGWGEAADGWGAPNANGWEAPNADGWEAPNADGWEAPNADGWGMPTTDSWAKEDGNIDQKTSTGDGAIDKAWLPKQSLAGGPAQVLPRTTENNSPLTNKTTSSLASRDSALCRFYIRGRCNWGSRCSYRHDGANNNSAQDAWSEEGRVPHADERRHDRAQSVGPAGDSWGETVEAPGDVPFQADECRADPVERPAEDSWGETTATPWDIPVRGDKISQATSADDLTPQDGGLGQTNEAGYDAPTSSVHKWALVVADEAEVVVPQHRDDDEKTWSTPWSDNVTESIALVPIHAPCKAFGQGYCYRGDSCRYQHITPPDPVLEAQAMTIAEGSTTDMPKDLDSTGNHADADTEVVVPDVHLSVDRNMFNCTMCFGPGCSPMNVLTACESRRTRLSNISPTVTHDELRDITNSFGRICNLTIDVGEASANAIIEFGEPAEAIAAATHLDGQIYNSRVIEARLDTVATEWNMRPLVSHTFKVSWLAPILSAWALYPTITTAKTQEKRLDGWTFNGRKLKAEFHRPRPKQTHSFGVRITGLPAQTSKQSLEQLCEESTLVVLDDVTYDSSPVNNAIYDILANLGPLDSFEIPSWDNNQSKVVGFAQFRTAPETVLALNATPQHFLGGSSLSVHKVYHAKYSLFNRQFHAVRDEIDRLGSIHRPHCDVLFYENAGQDQVLLHVYGDFKDPGRFGRFNIELQALMQGEILMSQGEKMWDEYFGISSSAKALEKFHADNSFFIQVDNRTQAIRVVGTESSRQTARTIVSRLLKKVRAQRYVIPLDMVSLRGLLHGGYQTLQASVGLNKVTLDVVASELIVRGDSEVVRQVHQALDTYAPGPPSYSSGLDPEEGRGFCPVCCRNPIDPIKLSCRHAYCQTCLQHVLQTSGQLFTPPRCIAASAGEDDEQGQQCTENIPYTVIRDLLRTDEEEQLLKASFLYHVCDHPDEYFFCPTPNCETVYGHGREEVVYRCPSCSTQICSTCHLQYHAGLTCSERREM